jgi:hypothetical protein
LQGLGVNQLQNNLPGFNSSKTSEGSVNFKSQWNNQVMREVNIQDQENRGIQSNLGETQNMNFINNSQLNSSIT